ncbi:hypothetical protein WMG39_28605, partial [Microcoleus anatoxicus PTRS2]
MSAKKIDEQRQQAYFDFLMKLLLVAAKSEGNDKLFHPLFLENIELLNEEFALYLRIKVNQFYEEYEFQQSLSLAAIITLISEAIQKFPQGSKANNLEIAIAGYEAALPILSQPENQLMRAHLQNNLGLAYKERIYGNVSDNIEQAIQCDRAALQIFTYEAF